MIRLMAQLVNRRSQSMLRTMWVPVVKFGFVNWPITSKYYHTPLPNQIEPVKVLAQQEKKLNEKCLLLQHITELVLDNPKLYSHSLADWMAKQL